MNESLVIEDCDANISEFNNDLEINMQKQTIDAKSVQLDKSHAVIELQTI